MKKYILREIKKSVYKRSKNITAFATCVLCLSVAVGIIIEPMVFAADDVKIVSEGRIDISSQLEGVSKDSAVTLTVVDAGTNWLDKAEMKSTDPSAVVYMDKTAAGENGCYNFTFYLENAGKYNVFVGGENRSEPDEFTLFFTKKTENDAAVSAIKNASDANAVYEVLCGENSAVTLKLYNPMFDVLKNDEKQPLKLAAQYIYDYISSNNVSDEALTTVIYNAAAVCIVNGDTQLTFDSIDNYKDIMQLENIGVDKYYDKALSQSYTQKLTENKYTSIGGLNDGLIDTILTVNIRYGDSQSEIKTMLTDLSEKLNIKQSDITDNLVREIIGKDFADASSVKEFIDSFNSQPTAGGGNVSGGSSGGGGGKSSGLSTSVGNIMISDKYVETSVDTPERIIFNDLENYDWAKEYIDALFKKGIINGKGQGMFCPGDYVTREEFVKMITEAYSLNVVGTGMAFDDVSEDEWYFPYVSSAYYAGIINGISENTFGTGHYITRQDLAVIADRASYIAGVELSENIDKVSFADESEIDDYAALSVEKLQRAGIINGDENGRFNPRGAANRAETAKIVYMLSIAAGK